LEQPATEEQIAGYAILAARIRAAAEEAARRS
jgi:hypothetical protein